MWRKRVSNSKADARERQSNVRWWEQYAVRYFVGTVIGALIVYLLRSHANLKCDFADLLPSLNSTTGDTGSPGWDVTILGAVGLAFCYVASAPILALHASRASVVVRNGEKLSVKNFACYAAFGGVLAIVALILWKIFDSDRALAWGLLGLILVPQVLLLRHASKSHFSATTKFYERLVEARFDDWRQKRDFVDSYRHLREHGNAMSIVLMEIVFGLIIANVENRAELIVAVVLWIVPAAYCWLAATIVEARFAK